MQLNKLNLNLKEEEAKEAFVQNLNLINQGIDRLRVAKPSQNIFLKKVGNVNQLNTMWTLSQHCYPREQVKNKSLHLITRNY